MRKSGALTIAQDAASSVVYGMPKAAAEINGASEILPLEAIGRRISEVILHRAHTGTDAAASNSNLAWTGSRAIRRVQSKNND
jgi:hypothetical protein